MGILVAALPWCGAGDQLAACLSLAIHRQGLDFLAYASLACAFGCMGMMLSPIHLCLLVTQDYFAANLVKAYRLLLGPVAMVLVSALFFFGLWQLWSSLTGI